MSIPAPDDPRIRPAVAGDADAIAAVVDRAYARYVDRIGRKPAPMGVAYDAVVAEGAAWVIEIDRRIAGVIVLRWAPSHLMVENVAVDPAFQGRGIGRRLLVYAEGLAVCQGLTEARLYTHQLMHENLAVYARLGWEEYDRSVQDGFPRVFLRKRLAENGADRPG